MRTIIALSVLLTVTIPAQAGFYRSGVHDGYRATKVWWKGWSVSSSEGLWKGRIHSQFPLSHLFDGDPATTWADSSPRKPSEIDRPWRTRFGLNIQSETTSRIDELWIMNGYNKRRDLFLRNDRIVEMEIWINGTKVKTAHLSDRMGWHKIKLPPNNFRNLGLLFTGIRKGNGSDNDVCVSELGLYHQGKKIEMQMPKSVFFEDGNYSGDAPLDCALIASRGGKVVTQGVSYYYNDHPDEWARWSPGNEFVNGVWQIRDSSSSSKIHQLLWVADVNRHKIVLRAPLPEQENDYIYYKRLTWLNDRTFEVRWIEPDYSTNEDNGTIKFRKQYRLP